MKKTGTLNTHLAHVLAGMGHTDRLVVCDAGLPVPRGVRVVDVALRPGLPGFLDTLDVILAELCVESAVVADELAARGGPLHAGLAERLAGIPTEHVPHDAFKRLCAGGDVVAVVRTGEATPYANVILSSGVTF